MMPFKATQKGDKFKFLILNRVSVGVGNDFYRGLLLLTVLLLLNICRRIRKLFPLQPLTGIPSSATSIPCWSEQSNNNNNSLNELICSSPPCPLSSICPFPLQFVLHTFKDSSPGLLPFPPLPLSFQYFSPTGADY